MPDMDNIGVNEQVVSAEKALEKRLSELRMDILVGIRNLAQTYSENRTGLGAHTQSINRLLEALGEFATGDATAPVKKLEKKLKRSYTLRQSIIDNDVYGGGGRRL